MWPTGWAIEYEVQNTNKEIAIIIFAFTPFNYCDTRDEYYFTLVSFPFSNSAHLFHILESDNIEVAIILTGFDECPQHIYVVRVGAKGLLYEPIVT